MPTTRLLLARVLLLLCGVATLALALSNAGTAGMAAQQVQLLTLASGAALLLAAVLPPLRLPGLGIALLVKLSYLAAWWSAPASGGAQAVIEIALAAVLAALFTTLVRESRREARWDGGQSLRLEA